MNNMVSNYFLLGKETPSLRERAGAQGRLRETPHFLGFLGARTAKVKQAHAPKVT